MKRFLALTTAIIMAIGMTSCGSKAESDSKEKKETVTATAAKEPEKKKTTTTATTTTAETTTTTTKTETTTTTVTEESSSKDPHDTSEMKVISEDTLSDGTKVTIYQFQKDLSWSIMIDYSTDDIVSNLITLSDFVSSMKDSANDLGYPDNVVIFGSYNDNPCYTYDLTKENGTYKSVLGALWVDKEYENTYNSIMDGTIDLSEYVENDSDSSSESQSKDLVIFENNGIKITYKGYDPEGGWSGPYINLLIENSSDKTYTVQVNEFSANGYMLDPVISAEVSPGKKINDSIKIYKSELEGNGLSPEDLSNVEFSFHVFNSDDWLDYFDTVTISFDL